MADSISCRNLFNECEEDLRRGFTQAEEETDKFAESLKEQLATFFQAIKKFAKTGEVDQAVLNISPEDLNDESDQENVPDNKAKGRRLKPLVESTKSNVQGVKIKKEKISIARSSKMASSSVTSAASSVSDITAGDVKIEKVDMPAPCWIPPKKKTKEVKAERASVRSTRTKGKKHSVRDSDVIVQNTTVTTINLTDTDESESEKACQKEEQPKISTIKSRKTRTKKDEHTIEIGDVEGARSTRTKTIRKDKKANDENKKDDQDDIPLETRRARTKTIKKGVKDPDESSNVNNIKEEKIVESTRSTRTKTKKAAEKDAAKTSHISQKSTDVPNASNAKTAPEDQNEARAKRNRSGSMKGVANDVKKSKSSSSIQDIDGKATTRTVYEDARSTKVLAQEENKQLLNATYVASVPPNATGKVPLLNDTVTIDALAPNAANCTVVVDKQLFNIFGKKSDNDLFTDDESIEIRKTPPKKAPTAKSKKEVFSPYEKTTLKKKVEAFEKLQTCSEIPLKCSTNLRGTPSAVKEKAKLFTPLASKCMPGSSSTSKISKYNSSSNDSLSAMKSAQKEARDRQRRHMEREQALKKKEDRLQAQAEAKKRENEEKQYKAQQHRKALEAEKLKQLEVQKEKELKLKQREAERLEYLKKQKEEVEKKRAAQKMKKQAMELQRQKILEEQARDPPVYMTTRPPKLPTADCYDSDDENYKHVVQPSWCVGSHSRATQLAMLTAGEKIKNTLFCCKPQTPDLVDIFEKIDPKKLKRSSSRLWKEPPRYTMMPDLNETKFEEDDELSDSN